MALVKCPSCNDQFEEEALFEGGVCRFCVRLDICTVCSKRFNPNEMHSDGVCNSCHDAPFFRESPRPPVPCKRCAGHTLWRRFVTLASGQKMEQFICKNCGFTEQYAGDFAAIKESANCKLIEVKSGGIYR